MNGLLDTEIAHVLTVADNSNTHYETNKITLFYDATKYCFSNRVVNAWNDGSWNSFFT